MAPFYKARWNGVAGYVQPRAVLTVDQVQEMLKNKASTSYVKYCTIDGHVCFGQVHQVMVNGELEIRYIVQGKNTMGNSYDFGLWYLPAMNDFDTIEFKTVQVAPPCDDFIPCPQQYMDAIESQVTAGTPEGW